LEDIGRQVAHWKTVEDMESIEDIGRQPGTTIDKSQEPGTTSVKNLEPRTTNERNQQPGTRNHYCQVTETMKLNHEPLVTGSGTRNQEPGNRKY
jgi:hypothetical protein